MTETELLQQIVEKQDIQIELLHEQINGLTILCEYQNYMFALLISVVVVGLLWNILNKWFFRGC